MHVTLFVTCVVDLFQPEVGVAAVRVLRAGGCEVSCPLGQTCCGQPAWNSGHAAEAAKVARTTLDALESDGGDVVVVPAGSCATMIRVFWPELFEVVGDARCRGPGPASSAQRTKELSELLVTLDLPELHLSSPERVAYHHSCHMLRELRPRGPADGPARAGRRLPAASRGRPTSAAAASGACSRSSCPRPASPWPTTSSRPWPRPAPTTLVGCDTSCLLHLRGRAEHEGRTLRTRHLVEVLAAALPSAPDAGSSSPAGPRRDEDA